MHRIRVTRKPQARTEATKAKILDAAQSVFAESGFENAQLEEIAVRAGCSRGGIYAHYASKEDLFLALMEQRVSATFRAACQKIVEEPDFKKRQSIFRRWLVRQVSTPDSGTLTLEYKLYAVRRPERRDELLHLFNALFTGPDGISIELLFGTKLNKTARIAIEQRFAVLGGRTKCIDPGASFPSVSFFSTPFAAISRRTFRCLISSVIRPRTKSRPATPNIRPVRRGQTRQSCVRDDVKK